MNVFFLFFFYQYFVCLYFFIYLLGGAIVIGQESIVYHDGQSYVAVDPPQIKVNKLFLCLYLIKKTENHIETIARRVASV